MQRRTFGRLLATAGILLAATSMTMPPVLAQEGKTITGGFDVGPGGFPGNFNPFQATAGFTWLSTYYEPLVIYTADLSKIVGDLATEYSVSDDSLTYTFKLAKQNWHDGEPFTSADVKFSLERQMAPNSLSAASATMRRFIKSIDVIDAQTVRVNTNTPQLGFPASLSRAVAPEGAIMPKDYIGKVGEEEFRRKPIGSGPWRFTRNVPGDRIEFTTAGPHWRGNPRFKDLHILLVPEESTRVAMVNCP